MYTRASRLGSLLIFVGVGVWGVYAAERFALGWNVAFLDFLPYHLAAISPGMYLRNLERLAKARVQAMLALRRFLLFLRSP